ncbi:late competence protein, phosphoribosyltransferase [Lactiplantibacillus pentosus KCA1]|nr:late competence protein, phosphoribosyltransferase [Lactiplantibacillus pentosus KCA1]
MCQSQIQIKLTLPWLLSWQPMHRPVVCNRCWQRFEPIKRPHACPGCGRAQDQPTPCLDCARWPALAGFHNEALFRYNEAMHAYFHQYKFSGDYQLRQVFATVFQQAIRQRIARTATLVVIIPVTPATMQTRGFNQVSGWMPTIETVAVLTTQAATKLVPQSKKDRHARLQTPQPFRLDTPANLAGQSILLVDDIYTTGRTIRHAASLLLENGAKSVTGLTLAR